MRVIPYVMEIPTLKDAFSLANTFIGVDPTRTGFYLVFKALDPWAGARFHGPFDTLKQAVKARKRVIVKATKFVSVTSSCSCDRPHYPLEFFKLGTMWLSTRGDKPVRKVLDEGWDPTEPTEIIKQYLTTKYNESHPFDWLHTIPYADNRALHMKQLEQQRKIRMVLDEHAEEVR